ncbi:MAG: hypothetical protein PVF58_08845 [Candidatus Methanofastidiosia archaeon]
MSQIHDINLIEMKKNGEEFFKEFKSIVKKKLDKPLNLKKIYYEQMDSLP